MNKIMYVCFSFKNMKRFSLEIVVFICGAVVMAYQIVGSRMLGPYVGTSIMVDSSIDGDYVRVDITDNGVGITRDDMEKLFVPFPGILVAGNVSGTGLGLSISKSIIELHGGQIWAYSEGLDKGSVFSFTIPL